MSPSLYPSTPRCRALLTAYSHSKGQAHIRPLACGRLAADLGRSHENHRVHIRHAGADLSIRQLLVLMREDDRRQFEPVGQLLDQRGEPPRLLSGMRFFASFDRVASRADRAMASPS